MAREESWLLESKIDNAVKIAQKFMSQQDPQVTYDDFASGKPLPMMRGKVRKLKEGFGFIAGDDGRDYFFHWTALQRTTKNFKDLEPLDRVEGSVIESTEHKGPRLIEIRVIDDRPPSHPLSSKRDTGE